MERTKAGFIFAYQGGSGVALVKDAKSQQWGPAAFLKASEASLGFLAGGQQSFLVILFMSPEAAKLLGKPTVDFGGEARGTAGDASAGAEGTISNQERPVLVYDDRRGLYGGASIKGGSVAPDEKANLIYYGQALMSKEILFDNKVKPTAAAVELAGKIDQLAKSPKK
jgi:lipid-binding SYLF domain-containing protein